MRMVWFHHSTEEELGFLLVGDCSSLKNNNYTGMLWMVRHLWSPGAKFNFNCYRHHK